MGPVLENSGLKIAAKKGESTALEVEYGGLCAICKNAGTCTFPRNKEKPIIECDEWEGFETRMEEPSHAKLMAMIDSMIDKRTARIEPIGVKGLCQYCSLRKTCTYPKKEGGIWTCDEREYFFLTIIHFYRKMNHNFICS